MTEHSRPSRFAVVIPLYNHGKTIGRVVQGAQELNLPVFVVDDGSTEPVEELLKPYEGITLIRHGENSGKGAALLTGFKAAAGEADFAITLDADGQHNPADAHELMRAVRPGQRALVASKRQGMLDDKSIPWTSRFGRKFSNFWVWFAGGPRLSDSQCGFRIYPIDEVLKMKIKARRFQFEVEVLVLANWLGMEVAEVPVSVVYPPGSERISHFRPLVDFLRNSYTFTRLIAMRIFLPAPLRRRLITK